MKRKFTVDLFFAIMWSILMIANLKGDEISKISYICPTLCLILNHFSDAIQTYIDYKQDQYDRRNCYK